MSSRSKVNINDTYSNCEVKMITENQFYLSNMDERLYAYSLILQKDEANSHLQVGDKVNVIVTDILPFKNHRLCGVCFFKLA